MAIQRNTTMPEDDDSVIYVDRDQQNADWTKLTWDLPPYKSREFMNLLKMNNMTLEHFRTLPVYKFAVRNGKIVNDQWINEGNKKLSFINKQGENTNA